MPFDAPFPISFLTLMILNLSSLLDSGKHDDISLEDVREHARAGDLIPFLNDRAKRVGDTFDNGFFEVEPRFVDWYGTQLTDICDVMETRERRKFRIESRGLCLLISYTAEIIQRGENIRLKS